MKTAQPLETSELLAFARVVESRSLTRAAAELGVPRATLGRRLARLEQRLHTRLLRRTTRTMVVTDAGQALYRHACIVLDALEYAERSVRQDDGVIRGDLRVSTLPTLTPGFSDFVGEFCRAHPEVRLHLHFSAQHVDLMRDGYDVALRATTGSLEPGLVARTITRIRHMAVASPAYLAAHGTPSTARELTKHRCLMGFVRGETPQTHWQTARGRAVQVQGALFANDPRMLLDLSRQGMGIALAPAPLVQPYLDRGELVEILQNILRVEARISVLYLERELTPPAVRAFVDALVKWAEAELMAEFKT